MAKKKSKKKHKKAKKQTTSKQVAPKQAVKSQKAVKSVKKAVKSKAPSASSVSADNRKYLIFIVVVILGALLIAVLVLANQTNVAKNDATNTGQDELLKVQPGNPESLQPSGANSTNPQQSSPSPQGDGGAANEIQPQTPVTEDQSNQIQQ